MPTFDELRRQRQQRQAVTSQPTNVGEDPFAQQTTQAQPPAITEQFQYKKPEVTYDTPEWEAARKNPQLLTRIKRYAKNVDNKDFSDDNQAFDWFVGDRRWKDANVWSTVKELNYVKQGFGSKYASEQDLEDLAFIRSEWEKLPGGIERIAKGDVIEGAGAIIENVAKGLIDPSILLGGVIGKGVGKVFATKAASEASKQLTKRVAQTGAAIATDAALTGGANLAYQETNVEQGLQEEVSGWDALVAGGLGALLSTPGHISAFKPTDKSGVDPMKAAELARQGTLARREKGLPDLFTGGKNVTKDGREITVEDIAAAKQAQAPQELPFDQFSREVSKQTKAARKGTGLSGASVREADDTFYDPLTDTIAVKSGTKLTTEDAKALGEIATPVVDAKWKKEKLNVTVEDGTKVEVDAGTVAKSLTERLKKAQDLMICLSK